MHLVRPYDVDEEEALARLRALTDYWTKKHGIAAAWNGTEVTLSGRVKGVKFDGTIRVGAGCLEGDVNAGFLAEKLGGRQYVERKLADYLDPAKTLAELRARIPR